ncbi:transporter substrate-binding domain-containing protein [Paucibacter sp. DJ1R-11]|uniref:substrate-binding periplasmic protein n=1 Tax=Paucibacter sp. DJ1R-11 TaxID=2893556 RepID=UPI0021E4A85D|nr:transporter substrate-binding domain-containing protein [Paucibacter sp. DJ1R-11]MCV2362852.1 transporter substrate-binding domain-containing protein [Paucibacter sp. DJ1R-11]
MSQSAHAAGLAVAGMASLQAFTEHLPPLNFQDDSGRAAGFSTELLQLMAAQARIQVDIQVQPWPRAVQAAAVQPNSILYSLTRLPERESKYRWVGPISERRIMLYSLSKRRDIQPLKDLRDLRELKVGVVRESAAARLLQAEGLRPGEELELALDDGSNLRKLLASRMDLIVLLDWAAAWHLKQLRLDYSTLRPLLELDTRHSYWYGLHPDSDDRVVQALQAALDQLRSDGRYARLRQRYFG